MLDEPMQWVAYTCRGDFLGEVPGLEVSSSISSIIGRGDSVTVKIPLHDPRCPSNWRDITQPMRAVLAATMPQVGPEYVFWAGWVEKRSYGSGTHVEVTLQPAEGWLARNYINKAEFKNSRYTDIAKGIGLTQLAQQFNGRLEVVDSNDRGDRTYLADQDMTYLKGLQNLMNTRHGAEFSTHWEIESGKLRPVIRIAPKLGKRDPHLQINFSNWTITQDCSDGKGATMFTVVSTREADHRVELTRKEHTLLTYDWIQLERRWQPDTGSVNSTILDSYLSQTADSQRLGTISMDMELNLDIYKPGVDFDLGDYVFLELVNPTSPEVQYSGTPRVVGWVSDPNPVSGQITSVKPILQFDQGV